MKKNDYYESEQFYNDIDSAGYDIAKGKGITVTNIDELMLLLSTTR